VINLQGLGNTIKSFKKMGGMVIASTLIFSTIGCGVLERSATAPCSTPESTGSVSTKEKLTPSSKVTLDGIGPVKVGMTVAEAESAAGIELVGTKPNWGGYTVKPKDSPNVLFLVVHDRIATVDVGDRQITTHCGAKLGDTEARIKALYPGIEVTPHKYAYAEGWHRLTLIPKDSKDSNYRIVFETDGKHVILLRAGKIPEVEYVEGG
jgi:hypothetical protein